MQMAVGRQSFCVRTRERQGRLPKTLVGQNKGNPQWNRYHNIQSKIKFTLKVLYSCKSRGRSKGSQERCACRPCSVVRNQRYKTLCEGDAASLAEDFKLILNGAKAEAGAHASWYNSSGWYPYYKEYKASVVKQLLAWDRTLDIQAKKNVSTAEGITWTSIGNGNEAMQVWGGRRNIRRNKILSRILYGKQTMLFHSWIVAFLLRPVWNKQS